MVRGSILVIEDNEDIREAVRILLENENYAVMEAENGAKGLELLTEDTGNFGHYDAGNVRASDL